MLMGLIALNDAEIIKRVQLVLDERGITNERLYALLGIYEQKWTGWKRRGIPANWHYSFAKALGVSMEWLLVGEGQKVSKKPDLTDTERKTLLLLNNMVDFQQIEWIAIGELMAEEAERFRKSLSLTRGAGDH